MIDISCWLSSCGYRISNIYNISISFIKISISAYTHTHTHIVITA